MLLLYLVGTTCACLIFGSIIPIIQFLLNRKKREKNKYTYSFPDELFNIDLDSVDEDEDEDEDEFVSRAVLSNRGWIRGPQGNIMTRKTFREKRDAEYNIELP